MLKFGTKGEEEEDGGDVMVMSFIRI